ncbi:MAG: hypothetical protein R3293_10120 [Candidatus Promineifilaceae bacterium]|nr:hypothetical protein [Candidatus Promineifilaceae bacterium]
MSENSGKLSRKRILFLGLTWVFVFLLAACGPPTPSSPTEPAPETVDTQAAPELEVEENESVDGYPPPPAEEPVAEGGYPVEPPPPVPTPPPDSYPAAAEEFAEPRFRIDLPLKAGNTTISGQAPPDLAIAVVDVTYNGIVLGSGRSDANGRFEIGVQPLPNGNRVGLTFAELEGGKTYPEMAEEYFPHRGEGFINIPNVGIFFDSALVEP